MKCHRFVWATVSNSRKQTGPPDARNNLRKSHFFMCHVTKYSRVSPTAILNEEKALGTGLDTPLSFQGAACENGGRELGLSL